VIGAGLNCMVASGGHMTSTAPIVRTLGPDTCVCVCVVVCVGGD